MFVFWGGQNKKKKQGRRKEEKTNPPPNIFLLFRCILEKTCVPKRSLCLPRTLNIHPHIQSQKHFNPQKQPLFFPFFSFLFFSFFFFFSLHPLFSLTGLCQLYCCSLSVFSLFIFFIFIRLFWNQILTWRSVRLRTLATSYLRSRVRYILNKNSFSSSRVWYFV